MQQRSGPSGPDAGVREVLLRRRSGCRFDPWLEGNHKSCKPVDGRDGFVGSVGRSRNHAGILHASVGDGRLTRAAMASKVSVGELNAAEARKAARAAGLKYVLDTERGIARI